MLGTLFRSRSTSTLGFVLFVLIGFLIPASNQCERNGDCKNGYCTAGMCICNPGWWGNLCQFCRLRLSGDEGVITDGDGEYPFPSKCSWLIESHRPNSTIHFDLEQFATECNWDHLYIYDGKSVESPLVGVLSGIIKDTERRAFGQSLMLQANSGAAFLYFYSDKFYNEEGFRIRYSISRDCSVKCSFHGHCDKDQRCVCDPGWTGTNCDIQTCIANCVNGFCSNTTRLCVCNSGFSGASCNVTGDRALWTQYSSNGIDLIQRRASHASAVLGDYMWVFGGFSLNSGPFHNFVRYHVPTDNWEVVSPSVNYTVGPSRRYGHSMVAYNGSLYVFGGRIGEMATNELWSFDTWTLHWSLLPSQGDSPLPVAGHTATLVDFKMIVLFGHGPQWGYTDKVQEYDLETGIWSVYDVPREIIKPSFGHSSAYDPVGKVIYIHGGFADKDGVSPALKSYDPYARTWQAHKNSSVPRFLHAAVFVDGMMLVFGGNSHNGTVQKPSHLPCFSMDFLAYDTACDKWKKLSVPRILRSSGRYGHTAVIFNRTMFVFGGFQGVLLNDLLSFTPGPCALIKDKNSCEMHFNSSDCVWSDSTSTCLGPERCVNPQITEKCSERGQSCLRCTSGNQGCSWCENKKRCVEGNCPSGEGQISSPAKCSQETVKSSSCKENCAQSECFNISSCDDCVERRTCMWCESQNRCVATNAYTISFPFGQCRGWNQGDCPAVRCSGMKTCDECHTLPRCGWCDDGSGTGLGQCMEGGDDGPFSGAANALANQCPVDRWFFVECPACQCNGHSNCINRNICEKCEDRTAGPHCEICAPGHFGNAKNGGSCQACECNGHANTCDSVDGKCNCLARYVSGDQCDSCEKLEQYEIVGNASNGGHCYNKLESNYHFTFNVSNKTSIAFLNIPTENDVDVEIEVEIKEGEPAYLNLSFSSVAGLNTRDLTPGYSLARRHKIGRFVETISHDLFNFGGRDSLSGFKVHVFDIKGFVTLQVTFRQKSKFRIFNFFITFFACFFSLLFVLALAWKIKVRYSNYIMARHRVEEMKQMASRPFAKVCLVLTDPSLETSRKATLSSLIAVQPTENHNAAVGVFMMQLPAANDGFAPIGQTGICCATALGTRGNHVPQFHSVHSTCTTVVKRSNMMKSCCA